MCTYMRLMNLRCEETIFEAHVKLKKYAIWYSGYVFVIISVKNGFCIT